ncbi:phage tail protein, partial [Pectobacterium punjabense]|uniref:phage tail protein n=1 Tax=Pectobacterium punjabense TaxID=2108399 RepID=UPI002044DA52
MANLSENPQWVDGIYQIETSDPVVGGPDGVSNRQAKELASRTRYLKKEQEKTGSDLATHAAAADPHTQYAPKADPTFTGTPKAPTPTIDSNSQQVATTAFVKSVVAALVNGAPGALDTLQELAKSLGNDPNFSATVLNAIADVKAEAANKLNAHNAAADPHTQYAPKASPALTGKPTAPTAVQASNDTQVATTAFVKAAVAALVNGSPAALDTLQELANALGNDPKFSTTVLNALAGKLAKDQNGADIADKNLFVKNIGAVRAFHGAINIGGDSGSWKTSDFIAWLKSQGAFNHPSWVCKGTWSYASNKIITDTGVGNIQLAGAVIEVFGLESAMTIRITTPSTVTAAGAIPNAQFTYINHGDGYSPGWRRDYNTRNLPAAADVGAYTKAETDTCVAAATTAANNATTAATNANTNANGRVPSGRKVNGKALTADITLAAADVGALPAAGTAAAAAKLATPRKINGVAFDGSADITLTPANLG